MSIYNLYFYYQFSTCSVIWVTSFCDTIYTKLAPKLRFMCWHICIVVNFTLVQRSPLNSYGKSVEKLCPSMPIIQDYFMLHFINGRELCPEHACELSGVFELARVKLSGLYCTVLNSRRSSENILLPNMSLHYSVTIESLAPEYIATRKNQSNMHVV